MSSLDRLIESRKQELSGGGSPTPSLDRLIESRKQELSGGGSPTPSLDRILEARKGTSGPSRSTNLDALLERKRRGIFQGGFLAATADVLGLATGAIPLTGAAQEVMKELRQETPGAAPFEIARLLPTALRGAKKAIKEPVSWSDYLRESDPSTHEVIDVRGIKVPKYVAWGFILDVATDPGWVVNPLGAAAKGIGKLIRPVVGKTAEVIPMARKIAESRTAMKVYEELVDRRILAVANDVERSNRLARQISRFSPELQTALSKYIEAGDSAARAVAKAKLVEMAPPAVSDQLIELANAWLQLDADLGRKLVLAGLMTEETFLRWQGRHLRRIYQIHEDPYRYLETLRRTDPDLAAQLESQMRNAGAFVRGTKAGRIDLGAVKRRKDIPEAVREQLGEIVEAAPRVAVGGRKAAEAAAGADFLRAVAANFAEDGPRPGLLRIPEDRAWGAVAGKWVPEAIHAELMRTARLPTGFERFSRAAWGLWKTFKTVYNPATHARNMVSNFMLADWVAGLSPFRLDIWAEAAKDVLKNRPLYREAKQAGAVFVDFTSVTRETNAIVRDFSRAKTLLDVAWRALSLLPRQMNAAYQFEEQWAKMAVYRYARVSLKRSPEQAAQLAEEALFNYRKVPRWAQYLRSGEAGLLTVPFVTFPLKAIPATAKAALRRPARMAVWFRALNAVEKLSEAPPGERDVLPKWMDKRPFLRLPVRDGYGRHLYLDLTYLLPFGDISEVGGLFGPGGAPGFLGLPLVDFIGDLQRNKSRFTGRQIWKDGATPDQIRDAVVRYVLDFMAPPIAGGQSFRNIRDAIMRVPDWKGRVRTLEQAVAGAFFGLKVTPLDLNEEFVFRITELDRQIAAAKNNIKKALSDPRLSDDYKKRVLDDGLKLIGRLRAEQMRISRSRRGTS